ncbi:YAP1-binding protein 1 [Oleoguttula sp. CCFEE 5521]
MAVTESDNPLIKALPPETDYISYLTIVEHYLTEDNLPILHKVLQDQTLTTNIGWDLVHLLAPLLPQSSECLEDIARLGNPREVILKVTESLRLIDYGLIDEAEDAPEDAGPGASKQPLRTAATRESSSEPTQAVEAPPPLPLQVSQFIALLSMLSTLHKRIKTKFPSRFLSTTLQAVLASFSNSITHCEDMIVAIVQFVKSVQGIQRPALPSRKSSGTMQKALASATSTNAADPEADATSSASPEDSAIQTKLLQSFVTHVLEEYMLNLSASDDVPGLAWCSRILERLHPARVVPHTTTITSRFADEEHLHVRFDAVAQLGMLAKDLRIEDSNILAAATATEDLPTTTGDEDDPPNSAADIPLSRIGSLLLYAGRQAASVLYQPEPSAGADLISLFPTHLTILQNCLSPPASGTGTLGTEPYALIDACLALGLLCLEYDHIGSPESDEDFNQYLQLTALLSSNCPSPNLRGHAHYLTTTVLRSQPDAEVRLAFIRDTLEHCPFENLKVSAVGWMKGETLEAVFSEDEHSAKTSIFATPKALESLSPFLFPSVEADLLTPPVSAAYMTFAANLSFYLASMNFLYPLIVAPPMREPLNIEQWWKSSGIMADFVQPLKKAGQRFGAALGANGELGEESSDEAIAELAVLDDVIARVEGAAAKLG